eukprot:CAMPEP_0194042762 /NCGR_PEP_ID=MMETSP0009_2-20130614/14510_1 /TAXON_ID=210454 /ORGANISM="Grammatophora oceanica, Strain CCMP 410" /LENGTH=407 /DNA_ID=CAMNT_0038686741 /DNA_START=123 /DNA_END=1346 /DNA_ORIENTATION=+
MRMRVASRTTRPDERARETMRARFFFVRNSLLSLSLFVVFAWFQLNTCWVQHQSEGLRTINSSHGVNLAEASTTPVSSQAARVIESPPVPNESNALNVGSLLRKEPTSIAFLYRRSLSVGADDVTLVTHCSVERFDILALLVDRWNGPVSLSVYIQSGPDLEKLESSWKSSPHLQKSVTVHALLEKGPANKYPVNIMRNLALDNIDSDYFFANDLDFIMNVGFYEKLKEAPLEMLRKRVLWVVPAFERFPNKGANRVDSLLDMPGNKEDLLSLLKTDLVKPFHEYFPPGHVRVTNFEKWYGFEGFSYPVEYQLAFEPYVVGYKHGLPKLWDGFRGFGLNKASWFVELHVRGYSFEVLGSMFVVHMNHPGRKHRTDRTGETQRQKSLLLDYLEDGFQIDRRNFQGPGF